MNADKLFFINFYSNFSLRFKKIHLSFSNIRYNHLFFRFNKISQTQFQMNDETKNNPTHGVYAHFI